MEMSKLHLISKISSAVDKLEVLRSKYQSTGLVKLIGELEKILDDLIDTDEPIILK